ncbi:hypothetical protein [Acinetobacter modestus]|uniref:hypothetical protein n=1 Tax=Acinetobacter modestus TaxID=1776740 RepID=UPI0030196114
MDIEIKDVERYGIVNWLPLGTKHGLRVGIANFTFRMSDGSTFEDAALFMCRKTFGYGRINITLLRKQGFEFEDDRVLINGMAKQAAEQLFRSTTMEDMKKIADIIEHAIDDLVLHPPENIMIEKKRQEREMELFGLVIKANDKIIVDAR